MRAAIPAADWISGYERSWLRADVVAGLTTAAVVIPKAMAYATIAGLPLQVGLYTAFIPMVVYAALGTSRTLSVSTTTTIAILCGAELADVAASHPGVDPMVATATLSMLVGAILLAARALRLGGESKSKEAGKMRLEGKEYIVQDGDVMHFRFNV